MAFSDDRLPLGLEVGELAGDRVEEVEVDVVDAELVLFFCCVTLDCDNEAEGEEADSD